MLPRFLVAAATVLAMSSSVLAAPGDSSHGTRIVGGRTCGSTPSAEHVAAAEAHFAKHKVTPNPDGERYLPITIHVYFHVIYKNNSCVSSSFFCYEQRFSHSSILFLTATLILL